MAESFLLCVVMALLAGAFGELIDMALRTLFPRGPIL